MKYVEKEDNLYLVCHMCQVTLLNGKLPLSICPRHRHGHHVSVCPYTWDNKILKHASMKFIYPEPVTISFWFLIPTLINCSKLKFYLKVSFFLRLYDMAQILILCQHTKLSSYLKI